MRPGVLLSALFHAAALAATAVAWSSRPPELTPESPVVPVEIVTFAETANVAPVRSPDPPEEIAEDVLAEGAPQPDAAPEEAEPAPEPAPKAEPPPKTAPKPKAGLDLDALALLVDKSKKPEGRRDPETAASARPAEEGERPRRGFGAQDGLTATEVDALRGQIERCWRAPIDAPNPERLVVRVTMRLNRDGSLAGAPELVSPRDLASADAAQRTAAQNALRAVRLCAPYDLPADRYEHWREVTMNFDPRQMLGQ